MRRAHIKPERSRRKNDEASPGSRCENVAADETRQNEVAGPAENNNSTNARACTVDGRGTACADP